MSFNKAIVMGNLGRDPEISNMNNGDQVANFSIATSERWTDKATGQRKESTEWHNIVCYNQGIIKVIDEYLEKGKSVLIEGQMKTRTWEKDGVKHYRTEIVIGRFNGSLTLVGGRSEGGGRGDRDEHSYGTTRDRDENRREHHGGVGSDEFSADLDDEIPF